MNTILVVDDEPDIRELLVDILRDEGYVTLAAGDGVAALEVLRETAIDVVIADTMMPRLGGVELVRWMREHPALRDVPVILMSAALRPNLDGFSVCTFLPKPFDVSTLLDAVAEAVKLASS
jgi:CheY-like chemotaxis protein